MSRERIELPAPVQAVSLLARGAEAVQAVRLERAHAAGQRAGQAQSAATLEQALARLDDLASEGQTRLAHTAAELAVEIARTLLRAELPRGTHDIERIVRETLAEAAVGRSPCVVHLHPEDHARLASTRFRTGTRLEPDEGVALGDVHVETAQGLFVRDTHSALTAIARRLREDLT